MAIERVKGVWAALAAGLAVLLVAGGLGALYLLIERPGESAHGPSTAPPPVARAVEIGVDLPFNGVFKDESEDTYDALSLYLDQIGGHAGPYRVTLTKYDNAPDPRSAWDQTECQRNAELHVARTAEVAVIGAFNAGCTKIELPILNSQGRDAMLMVSHANTNPGLTKPWDTGEPDRYYPTGVRNYARVVTTDDDQGRALAMFAKNVLHLGRCFVLNDTDRYGSGMARSFVDSAKGMGLAVVGEAAWLTSARAYVNVLGQAKAAGADCVVFSGIFDNHGAELMRDKVATLGPNSGVAVLAGDGFIGYPEFDAMPEADGVYRTYAGLATSQVLERSEIATKLNADFQARYGREIRSPYALYGVQALQLILAALERSDGTRAGLRTQVLGSSGVTIPAAAAILGRDIGIYPSTGDCTLRELAIERLSGGSAAFVMTATLTE
jgi:branched-chain amino acid transport system substrate-binding protein